MEIYWDQLAVGARDCRTSTLKTHGSICRPPNCVYRGFSQITSGRRGFPGDAGSTTSSLNHGAEMARPDRLLHPLRRCARAAAKASTTGCVIINAGDEMRPALPRPAPPPDRLGCADYVMVGDGWIKDGDYNSTFSKTVLPLPYRGLQGLRTAPGRLEDDPAYKTASAGLADVSHAIRHTGVIS